MPVSNAAIEEATKALCAALTRARSSPTPPTWDHPEAAAFFADHVRIEAAQAVLAQAYGDSFLAFRAALSRRAVEIARRGAATSGYPRSGDTLTVERIDADTVCIACREPAGPEGFRPPPWQRFIFPTRWLFLPDDLWIAELSAAVAESNKRREAQAAKRRARAEAEQAAAAAQAEKAEREQLAGLLAKYGVPASLFERRS